MFPQQEVDNLLRIGEMTLYSSTPTDSNWLSDSCLTQPRLFMLVLNLIPGSVKKVLIFKISLVKLLSHSFIVGVGVLGQHPKKERAISLFPLSLPPCIPDVIPVSRHPAEK